MAVAPRQLPQPDLYEIDFNLWSAQQENALASRRVAEVDWKNAAEEIGSLGRAQKKEIGSRLARLYQHLLKWHFQPERRCNSWQSTISGQRRHIQATLEASPSLSGYAAEALARAYRFARQDASDETGVPLSHFPELPPYPVEQALAQGFFPGPPWTPTDLIRD